ncbi:MAG: 4-(cytidine 5'-diphospho)-2-C-methyl-D-erythritol kinase [Desulfovermiculus sp.]
MPQNTILEAGCKANIYLRILGRRDDGYHELQSLFLPLDQPRDRLFVSLSSRPGLELTCSRPELAGMQNTLHRAYNLFVAKTGFRPGISIWLEKNIPQGAGLGGGSSDAAVLLRYLNDHCPAGVSLSEPDLSRAALEIGADVPFFLLNVPAWVQGIGERIRPVSVAFASAWLLVVCPDTQVATGQAFQAWDRAQDKDQASCSRLERGPEYPQESIWRGQVFFNSFESVIYERHPRLQQIKIELLRFGARGAVLSGSGAAVVGLFPREQEARQAAHQLQNASIRVFLNRVPSCWGKKSQGDQGCSVQENKP